MDGGCRGRCWRRCNGGGEVARGSDIRMQRACGCRLAGQAMETPGWRNRLASPAAFTGSMATFPDAVGINHMQTIPPTSGNSASRTDAELTLQGRRMWKSAVFLHLAAASTRWLASKVLIPRQSGRSILFTAPLACPGQETQAGPSSAGLQSRCRHEGEAREPLKA